MPGILWICLTMIGEHRKGFGLCGHTGNLLGLVDHHRETYGNTLKCLEIIRYIKPICGASLRRGLFEYYVETLEKGCVR